MKWNETKWNEEYICFWLLLWLNKWIKFVFGKLSELLWRVLQRNSRGICKINDEWNEMRIWSTDKKVHSVNLTKNNRWINFKILWFFFTFSNHVKNSRTIVIIICRIIIIIIFHVSPLDHLLRSQGHRRVLRYNADLLLAALLR